MVENYSQKRRLNIGNLNRGKRMSDKQKANIKAAALTGKKPLYSKEGLANMTECSKPLIVYNLDKTIYGEYPSISAGDKSLRSSVKTIWRAMYTPEKILKKHWIVKYLTR